MLPALYDFWLNAYNDGEAWAVPFRFLNLFQYITFRAASAGLLAFVLSLVFGPRVIRKLISLKVGQPIDVLGMARDIVVIGPLDQDLADEVCENGVIGAKGGMPWRLSTDLKRFKRDTMGKPVIMGRKTFESIGKPLPGRHNIVVTRDANWNAEGVSVTHSLEEALKVAESNAGDPDTEICIIGGGQLYGEAIGRADRLYVTHVMAEPEGDTYFPEIDQSEWKPVSREAFPAGEKDSADTLYVVYERNEDRELG